MEAFPENFSSEYYKKQQINQIDQTDLLNSTRQEIYEHVINIFKGANESLFTLPKEMSNDTKIILLKELYERFPDLLYYVRYSGIFGGIDKWIPITNTNFGDSHTTYKITKY